MSSIELRNVTQRFETGQEGLMDVSLTVADGSMIFVTGHSGAGKSTLLRLLIGLEKASSGQVLVGGVNIGRLARKALPWYRRQVGVVFQDHHLLPERSVFDNVALPLLVRQMPAKDLARRVRGALATVDLSGSERLLPKNLSTGEQQRVGIARAVATRPRIILADEPTGNLDPHLSRQVMALFKRFNELGSTVIVASHDLELIKAQQARTLELSGGRLVGENNPAGDGLTAP